MSIITTESIKQSIKSGALGFTPALDDLQFRPHAVDLRLGFTFRIPKRRTEEANGRSAVVLDHYALHNGPFSYYEEATLKPGQYFDVLPEESVMGFSLEEIDMNSPTLMGELYPRSSVSRRGLAVDLTGIIDAGYKGHLMFPIRNNTNQQVIRIYPGERICQLVFHRLEQAVEEGYQGRYRKEPGTAPTFQKEANSREVKLVQNGDIYQLKREFTHFEPKP